MHVYAWSTRLRRCEDRQVCIAVEVRVNAALRVAAQLLSRLYVAALCSFSTTDHLE